MIMKFFPITLVVFSLLASPVLVSAASTCTMEGLKANQNSPSTLPQCINQIYIWSLGIGALLALLMTIIGGYTYMTAAGNAEQAANGISYIWGAAIGLALLFTAYLLLNTINPDLVNFSFESYQGLNQTPDPGINPPGRR